MMASSVAASPARASAKLAAMGGNLFKLGRKPRAEYLEIEAEVRSFLDELIGVQGYRIPRYYGDKPDFGDLDVVVSSAAIEALGGFETFTQAIASGLEVSQTKNVGHVYSTAYRNLQVDYFTRPAEQLESTYNYLSFNDIGNLIGKIYRRLGFKYGEDGLSYVYRRSAQESYRRDIPVSRDWPRILALIELDVAVWQAGFDSLEHMFGWVVASPYFSVAPYRELSRSTEKRAKQRRTMARFLDWVEREQIEQIHEYERDRSAYVPWVAEAFPEAELEAALARERALEAEDERLRAKFSGGLVRRWLGLEGKQLGRFLRAFKRTHGREQLLSMSPEAIEAAVRSFEPEP